MGYSVSLSPSPSAGSFLYQSCSLPTMFTVCWIRFHCNRIPSAHCSAGLLSQRWVAPFIPSPRCGARFVCTPVIFVFIANLFCKATFGVSNQNTLWDSWRPDNIYESTSVFFFWTFYCHIITTENWQSEAFNLWDECQFHLRWYWNNCQVSIAADVSSRVKMSK